MTHYLLPCSCGETLPVATSQAGETVDCVCGRQLAVPTMREVRRLAPAPSNQPMDRRPGWSVLQGILFVTGVVVLLIGTGFAATAFYKGSKLDTALAALNTEAPSLELFQEEADKLDLMASLERWNEINEQGLGPEIRQSIQVYEYNLKVVRRYRILSYVAGGFAGCGLILVVISLLVRRPVR